MPSGIDVAARLRAQLRILQRTWRPLVLGVLPVSFLLGWLVGASAEAQTLSLVIGGAVLSLVGGAAAADQGFRLFAAGAPFLVVGLFSGVMLGRAGLSGVTLGSTFLFALLALLGGGVGTLARSDDKR
jgi:hypothetical protein